MRNHLQKLTRSVSQQFVVRRSDTSVALHCITLHWSGGREVVVKQIFSLNGSIQQENWLVGWGGVVKILIQIFLAKTFSTQAYLAIRIFKLCKFFNFGCIQFQQRSGIMANNQSGKVGKYLSSFQNFINQYQFVFLKRFFERFRQGSKQKIH